MTAAIAKIASAWSWRNRAGVGAVHGESSIAVGLSTVSGAGRYLFKLSASANRRDAAMGDSANIAWQF